ncbi:GHMP kinase [archaeon]|mgnify:CR=1 FL=1|jgi:D-glycero-alpha-D-manno-heptose-7-phosphate kinase|nr:GHMP kinase [archaeon]MBT3451368.1 GHMP kinase [archaeon]MBT6869316.1 GHMP kinase [archaeon]MBT7192479.1 GHMP kinase [archaeon]MBT7380555.1 GHMP kinase [archaeon]
MIISRTPFRVSFVGGGTDLQAFWSKEEGQVLSTSINKYIYVTVKKQLNFVEFKYRISWNKLEFVNNIEDIEHPIIREALKMLKIDFPLEITTFADIPSSTGLGSSSSFTVGLLHALYALKGERVTKNRLAEEAAHIEINMLGRPIGKQDHYAAAYGNLNIIKFLTNSDTMIYPVLYKKEVVEKLSKNLLLFYTYQKRDAHKILEEQKDKTIDKFDNLKKMKNLVPLLEEVISKGNLDEFGRLLHQNWILKREITDKISNSAIDEYYNKAINAGAIGGKLLGAGGGGFLLFYVPPEKQEAVRNALSELYELRFNFDTAGTRIIYYNQN